jgi:hypothetical protein
MSNILYIAHLCLYHIAQRNSFLYQLISKKSFSSFNIEK